MSLSLWQQTNGSVLNAIGVLVGALIGLFFRNSLPPRIANTVQSAIGLTTLFLGMRIVIALVAITVGGGIGEALNLDARLGALATSVQQRLGQSNDQRFSEGLFAAFLIFCVGPVTILGSIDNGLRGDNQLLIIKTVLDTITAAALASSYGMGVLVSAVPLLLFQGGISLAAGSLAQLVPDPTHNPIILIATCTGGIILLGLGLNLLDITKLRIATFLPALLLGPLFVWALQTFL